MKPLTSKILGVSVAILAGGLCMWLTLPGTVWGVGTKGSLCVLDLQGGSGNVAVSFTTSETLEQFFVVAS